MANETNLRPAQKGEVRNPYGKRGKTGDKGKHLATHIRELLNDPNFKIELTDGCTYQGRPIEGIVSAMIAKALNGDIKAFEVLARYGYDKNIDVTSNDEPYKIVVIGDYPKPGFRIPE